MRITPGNFSFLPELTDDQILAQINYCLHRGWGLSIEYTDDVHPRNTYWETYGSPMIDGQDASGIMAMINACRCAYSDRYVRVMSFDPSLGARSVVMSFLVNRPKEEPRFRLTRTETSWGSARPGLEGYAVRHSGQLVGAVAGAT